MEDLGFLYHRLNQLEDAHNRTEDYEEQYALEEEINELISAIEEAESKEADAPEWPEWKLSEMYG